MLDRYTFRGKCALNGEWLYGSLIQKDTTKIFHKIKSLDDSLIYVHSNVVPKTIGQCTGLKDKNGKLIYEGDILVKSYKREDYRSIPDESYGVIKWFDTTIGFGASIFKSTQFNESGKLCDEIVPTQGIFSLWDCDERTTVEIIGNIHDTTEMLN